MSMATDTDVVMHPDATAAITPVSAAAAMGPWGGTARRRVRERP